MDEKSPENEHNYLETDANGPHVWLLVAGGLFVGLIILGVFYGLYTLNRGTTPTGTPQPLPVVAVASSSPDTSPISGTLQAPTTPAATPTLTITPTATAKPPTYTVQQGDTLIEIAYQLNVNVDDLKALNQVSGETIYPDQTLLVPPTVTPWPETGPFPHIVEAGETLLSIAARYQVSVSDIRALNGLTSDTILADQRILIPAYGLRPPTPTPTPEPWQPAVVTETLDAHRWLTTVEREFTLYVDADARQATANEMAQAAWLVERALDQVTAVLDRPDQRFDVYLVTTLFEAPFTSQRGLSRPEENRIFVVYDEYGSPAERVYFTTYALTPLVAAQALGQAASPLLQEGMAVYTGMQVLGHESNNYLSRSQLCVAYQRADQMPRVSRPLTFEGHLGHFDQYLAAGCFVGYLIEQEGWEAFAQVYTSGDYRAAYEQTLAQLEQGWTRYLQNSAEPLPLDETQEAPIEADALVRTLTAVDEAYRLLWEDFAGTPAQFDRYRQLDQARLAALKGQLSVAREFLPALETPLDEQ